MFGSKPQRPLPLFAIMYAPSGSQNDCVTHSTRSARGATFLDFGEQLESRGENLGVCQPSRVLMGSTSGSQQT